MHGKQWEEPLCNRPAAPAGEPFGGAELVIQNLVYPRACGGTPTVLQLNVDARTPAVYPRACGGTRRRYAKGFSGRRGVYPRVCGGTALMCGRRIRFGLNTVGLSPRLRGNPDPRWPTIARTAYGSIPAPAGEPGPSVLLPVQERGSIPAPAGEPRGLLPLTPMCPRTYRSIPAPAGEPERRIICLLNEHPQLPVYPRACGGTGTGCQRGVSTGQDRVYPRACGGTNRRCRDSGHAQVGSIPAPAGEP